MTLLSPTETCIYCQTEYPRPVELHHTADECNDTIEAKMDDLVQGVLLDRTEAAAVYAMVNGDAFDPHVIDSVLTKTEPSYFAQIGSELEDE